MIAEWPELWQRIQKRAIRAADVLSIVVLDAVVLAVAYPVVEIAGKLQTGSDNRFYSAARQVSGAVFLVLYLAWVVNDVWEFLRQR